MTGIILGFLSATVWPAIIAFLLQFWAWIVAVGVAILGFMFSPAIRKYTIALIALMAIIGGTYVYAYSKGFNAPHTPTPPACSEYAKHLVKNAATDKALNIFRKYNLCT